MGGIPLDKNLKYALTSTGLFVVLFMTAKCVADGVDAAFGMRNIIGVAVTGLIYFALMFMWGAHPRR